MSRFALRTDMPSWGRVLRPSQHVGQPTFRVDLPSLVAEGVKIGSGVLPRGLGRSYGDTNVNEGGAIIDCTGLDRLISFEAETGLLRAEGGTSLERIIAFALPRGFFLPVVPGTKFVTLAGAIANDVHGKNHHRAGTIGSWIREIGLLRTDGTEHRVGSSDPTGLFAATIGGLGLTGIIMDATVQLRPVGSSMIRSDTIPFGNLDEFFTLSEGSSNTHEYTVAWLDCLATGKALGRGLFTRGDHVEHGPLNVEHGHGPSVPVDAPGFLLNRLSIAAFNEIYYRIGRRARRTAETSYGPFFFPLDRISNWNRLYGRRGMYQYQSVVPPEHGRDATTEMLKQISQAGQGSFLVVLKTFGRHPSPGMLSFPKEGTTLALDFPYRGASTLALMRRLDDVVREARGRLYPAKDGRLPRDLFLATYPFEHFRSFIDPGISSSFLRRMEEA